LFVGDVGSGPQNGPKYAEKELENRPQKVGSGTAR